MGNGTKSANDKRWKCRCSLVWRLFQTAVHLTLRGLSFLCRAEPGKINSHRHFWILIDVTIKTLRKLRRVPRNEHLLILKSTSSKLFNRICSCIDRFRVQVVLWFMARKIDGINFWNQGLIIVVLVQFQVKLYKQLGLERPEVCPFIAGRVVENSIRHFKPFDNRNEWPWMI